MDEKVKIAARLRAIAAEIENDFPEKEEMKKEFMENLKKNFLEFAKKDPRYINRDPEQAWRAFEKIFIFDIKKILG